MFPVAASRLPVNRRRLGWIALACSAAGLAMGLSACGGGSRNSFFAPGSIVSFGDENSAFDTYTGSLKKADGTPNAANSSAMIKGLTYTVQDAVVGASLVCPDTTTGQPSTPARECTASTSNGGAMTSPTLSGRGGYYGLSVFTSTKLEVESGASANQRTTTTTYNCGTPRIWVHVLARAYGRGFNSQCVVDPFNGAVSYAAFGAQTDDVIAQIAAHRGELNSSTLVTIMVGQNDILAQYAIVRASGNPSTAEAAAITELQARADRMAAAVKDVIGTGAKVVLSLTPSLNNSPKGVSGLEDGALLSRMVVAYNDRLYVRGLGNVSGRDLVGVNPDSFTNTTTRSTSYVHSTALCDTSALTKPDGATTSGLPSDVLFCTTANIVPGGSLSTYMWADATHFAPLGHSLIGSLAFNRARQQL